MKEKAIKVLDDGEHIFEVDMKKFKKEIRIKNTLKVRRLQRRWLKKHQKTSTLLEITKVLFGRNRETEMMPF
jgi:hypothetical protein